MDDDLDALTRAQLVDEVRRRRAGIRAYRDSSGHDRCWYHPQLWGLLPEAPACTPTLPELPQFMRVCIAYCTSLDAQCANAPRSREEFAPPKSPGGPPVAQPHPD